MTLWADPSRVVLIGGLSALSVLALLRWTMAWRAPAAACIPCLWVFFLSFTIDDLAGFRYGIWILALLSFVSLREYFTLVDFRLQDRWGIAGAYLSVPFMFWFIQTDWYGMFIVSIPVYAFLAMPFLVALGGRDTDGAVYSIGAIDLGLFLMVYCVGHIGYLALTSVWKAVFLVAGVAVCDLVASLSGPQEERNRSLPRAGLVWGLSAPLTVGLALLLRFAGPEELPLRHSIALGLILPGLVAVGRYTISHIESDLRIARERLVPGRGAVMDSMKSYLYAAPVVFHYVRYYL